MKTYSHMMLCSFFVLGTRWCGDGNKARSENDSGLFEATDACCKQHDQCPFNIQSGQSFGPLLNNGAFTRSVTIKIKNTHLYIICLSMNIN